VGKLNRFKGGCSMSLRNAVEILRYKKGQTGERDIYVSRGGLLFL